MPKRHSKKRRALISGNRLRGHSFGRIFSHDHTSTRDNTIPDLFAKSVFANGLTVDEVVHLTGIERSKVLQVINNLASMGRIQPVYVDGIKYWRCDRGSD